MMLTKEQLRYRPASSGWVEPCFVYGPEPMTPRDKGNHQQSDEFRFFYDYVGQIKQLIGQPLFELDAYVSTYDHQVPQGASVMGSALKQIFIADFLAPVDSNQPSQRIEILKYADRTRSQTTDFGEYQSQLAQVFESSHPPNHLYSDVLFARPITLARPITPSLVALKYNQALARGFMAASHRLTLHFFTTQPFMWIRFFKVWGVCPECVKAAVSDGGWTLSVDLVISQESHRRKLWRKCMSHLQWPHNFEVKGEFYPYQKQARHKSHRLSRSLRFSHRDFLVESSGEACDQISHSKGIYHKILSRFKEFKISIHSWKDHDNHSDDLICSQNALFWMSPPMAGFWITSPSVEIALDIFESPPGSWIKDMCVEGSFQNIQKNKKKPAVDMIWLVDDTVFDQWQNALNADLVSDSQSVSYLSYEGWTCAMVCCENVNQKTAVRESILSVLSIQMRDKKK